MILDPTVIALFLASILIGGIVIFSSFQAARFLRRWDLSSGSDLQLRLERKTYLFSVVLSYTFVLELISLFLFIYLADRLHDSLVGAMCAAGTLNANAFGYPALGFKILNFVIAGVWLILNHADHYGEDYPLLKTKNSLLLAMTPFFLAEGVLQAAFLLNLKPNIIVSCCGSLFSSGAPASSEFPSVPDPLKIGVFLLTRLGSCCDPSTPAAQPGGILSEVSSLSIGQMKILFFLSAGAAVSAGLFFYRKGKGGVLFSCASLWSFLISISSLITFISLYYYELPTHHCPFCFLQKEYGYAGYPLYLTLGGSLLGGAGVGVLMPFRNVKSLGQDLPRFQKNLALLSILSTAAFTFLVSWRMVFSSLILDH
jgi:hypothetical protein